MQPLVPPVTSSLALGEYLTAFTSDLASYLKKSALNSVTLVISKVRLIGCSKLSELPAGSARSPSEIVAFLKDRRVHDGETF